MTDLRAAAQRALGVMQTLHYVLGRGGKPYGNLRREIETLRAALAEDALQRFTDVNQELEAALAEPTLQTCNCRWDGEVQVQQCTLHEAHVDAIKEWAQRAKFAEKKLAALAEPCPCGDRSAAECPGEWEPGCDLGNNPKYAKRVNLAEPVQEPVRGSEMRRCPRCWEPMFPPQRKALTVMELQDALVYTNLIDPDAVNDPEGYDEGSTLAQIDELHRRLTT